VSDGNVDIEELGKAARTGDPSAMDLLCRQLRVSFVLLAKRRIGDHDLAEDLAQDALTVVAERLSTVPEGSQVIPWCLAVLRNVVGNYYSSRARLERLSPFAADLAGRWHGGASRAADEAKREIARVLPVLPIRCRKLLEWKLSGMSADEMQRRLGLASRNALYMRLHRCRLELKQALEAHKES